MDDGFFEAIDRVMFYGAGASGYAAAAFSVCAPGARVLLLNPVATLEPSVAGWDTRYRAVRRLDLSTRYGFAPIMVERTQAAKLICDLGLALNAMHAALFCAPHGLLLSPRLGGPDLEATFGRMGTLNYVIGAAMDGHLSAGRFGALWRNRCHDLADLMQLQVASTPRRVREIPTSRAREIMVCRNVAIRLKQNKFRKRLVNLTEANRLAADAANPG